MFMRTSGVSRDSLGSSMLQSHDELRWLHSLRKEPNIESLDLQRLCTVQSRVVRLLQLAAQRMQVRDSCVAAL